MSCDRDLPPMGYNAAYFDGMKKFTHTHSNVPKEILEGMARAGHKPDTAWYWQRTCKYSRAYMAWCQSENLLFGRSREPPPPRADVRGPNIPLPFSGTGADETIYARPTPPEGLHRVDPRETQPFEKRASRDTTVRILPRAQSSSGLSDHSLGDFARPAKEDKRTPVSGYKGFIPGFTQTNGNTVRSLIGISYLDSVEAARELRKFSVC